MDEKMSKKLGKDPKLLLSRRLGEYRKFIEEKDLVEQALLLLEEKNVNFWKSGLRIGTDLLGLTMSMPRGGARQINRVRQKNQE
jgi:hypothetical protein